MPKSLEDRTVDKWEKVAQEALSYARALMLTDGVDAEAAGDDLDEAWEEANKVISSGYLSMEWENLQEYSMPNYLLPARWFGFAVACYDFVRWIRGGTGSGRRPAETPITQVGDLILSLKHMNWEAPIDVVLTGPIGADGISPVKFHHIARLHQNSMDTTVEIQIDL